MIPNKTVLEYWDKEEVESMYDKHLLQQEVRLLQSHIFPGSKILDAGCGEGESIVGYANVPDVQVHAADFSDIRLKKAKDILRHLNNVQFFKIDFLKDYQLDSNYDIIISKRFLINLPTWELQAKVILDLKNKLNDKGRLLLLEGSKNGVEELNTLRRLLGMNPIPIKWHNLFFDDIQLEEYLQQINMEIVSKDGLGEYFFLTRGIQPFFSKELSWDSKFNSLVSSEEMKNLISFGLRFSRLKLWVTRKKS